MAGYYDVMKKSKHLIAGVDYMQVDLGFAYSDRLQFDAPLQRVFAPLAMTVWIIIGGMVCGAVVVILKTKNMTAAQRRFIIGGRVNRTPIYNMICIALGGNIANQHMRCLRYFGTFSRTLTMIWMLSFLILRNAYQCSLYDYLHTQKAPSCFESLAAIKQCGCNIIIDDDYVPFMTQFIDRSR